MNGHLEGEATLLQVTYTLTMVTNHLLFGMILQVPSFWATLETRGKKHPWNEHWYYLLRRWARIPSDHTLQWANKIHPTCVRLTNDFVVEWKGLPTWKIAGHFTEPKYLAFRFGDYIYIPCSSSDVRWARIPRTCLKCFVGCCTPWKINMEHTNHPFWKENDLPNLYDYVPC